MKLNFMIMLDAAMVFGATVIFILPLRKREKWRKWLPIMFLLCWLCMELNHQTEGFATVGSQLILYLCLAFMVNRCTKISLAGDFYCAIWAYITLEAVYELWVGFRYCFPEIHTGDVANTASMVVFTAILYLLIWRTIARWMPQGDLYQIGPRQLTSALLLGGMFITMSYYFMLPAEKDTRVSIVFALSQIYCISLLYLQTELFKKSQMEKDLEALNFLYSCEQQQYAAARQNVAAVCRKCEELEKKIAQMQEYLPEEVLRNASHSIDDAMRASDTVVRSGNDVLDIVLTEKKVLAEAESIQINCIADGKLLDFMEVVDRLRDIITQVTVIDRTI